jgi:CheY-like chemotaxis protein
MQHKGILVIEDDLNIREALKEALIFEGYQVYTAANGKEGLELVKGIPRPCLILLDLMMPVMDGFEFMNCREKDAMIAAIPVLIVSAFPDRAQKVQAQGFVKKPINLDLLLASVQQFCD